MELVTLDHASARGLILTLWTNPLRTRVNGMIGIYLSLLVIFRSAYMPRSTCHVRDK